MTLQLEQIPVANVDRERERLIKILYQTSVKAEIVNGEVIEYMATGGLPNFVAGEIFAELRHYARKTKTGYAVTDNAGFVVNLPNRYSFSPDAAFWTGSIPTMKFYEGAPIFAVEVRSESDYGPVAETEMRDKRADYFTAGTEVVWDVDTRSKTAPVRKFTKTTGADTPAQIFAWTEEANAEPAFARFLRCRQQLISRRRT